MKGSRFEYFLNAVHYCIYKEEVWSNRLLEKIVWKCFYVISKLFSKESYYFKRRNKFRKDSKYQDYMYGQKAGQSIGLAHHLFGFIYSAYPGFFSWIVIGIADRTFGELNRIFFLLLFGIPIGICYIPAYRAVFTDDKYLKYFKKFEKEDNLWHKKWKRITFLFCVGAIIIEVIGFFCMTIIASI